ncbi:hypothetical protein C5167_021557 [Papaver somniferum]|uniref:SNF2 domain-containing protein CLASSY 1-like n=1 Tax=Papaver somniferum TaxID=3469 RepID=UPI000E704284|nr:SNF2 domain-containing protein CLASSY 1-like [Papaver somniferum]RZC91844.1 hypothetical protein C5167_021557 [Papaver somniferum]
MSSTTTKKRSLYKPQHPIDVSPFEAYYGSSWWPVKSLSIRKGELDVHLESPDEVGVTEKIPVGNLRMRSRRATVSDCMCFLRPGVDICILSKDSGEEKVWIDAKVNSIARTPHESGCTCRFFVNLFRKRVPSDMRWWTLNKEIMEVTIDDIAVLQQLDGKPSEDEYHRWSYLKDCPSRNDAKLLRLQFSCDLSWMLVASTLKGFDFKILSMRRKIFYQFLEDNQDICSTGSDKALKFVNFYMDDDVFKPNILTIVPESALISSDQENTSMDDSLDDQLELRRSGRKSIQPERYVGNPWSSNVKSAKRTARVREVDEEPWEMSSEDNDWWDEPIVRTERTHDTIPNLRTERKRDTIRNLRTERKHDSIRSSNLQLVTYEVKTGSMDQPTVGIKRNHENMQASNLELVPSQINIGGIDQPVALDMKTNDDCMHGSDEMESSTEQLGGDVISVKRPRYADPPVVYETSREKKDLCKQQVQHCDSISKQSKDYFMSRMNRYSNLNNSASNIDSSQAEQRKAENKEEGGPSVSSKSSKGEKDLCEKVQHCGSISKKSKEYFASSLTKFSHLASKCDTDSFEEVQRKAKLARKKRVLECLLKEKVVSHEAPKSKTPSFGSRTRYTYEPGAYYQRKYMSPSDYRSEIHRCMKNINSEIAKSQSCSEPQWKHVSEAIPSMRWKDICKEKSEDKQENENEEQEDLDSLWKEMDFANNSFDFAGGNQGNNADSCEGKESDCDKASCQHEYHLDEEIGLICLLCKSVVTEIRDMSLPFLQDKGWSRCEAQWKVKNDMKGPDINTTKFDIFRNPDSARNISVQELREQNESVWALIPDLRDKLRAHQKKAFEFLWKNIAGSMIPSEMEDACDSAGGCVISHSPGAGKTLLVIAFLESSLRLFPGQRPVILAPNTTVYTWKKEMKKWKVPIPVYQIHSYQNYRLEYQSLTVGGRRVNQDVMHAVDCLDKLRKWHEHPSVLLMSYPCFLSLMREQSKHEYWRYMGGVLRESPGLLILDEGHNPRSSHSMLRRFLMEVKTELRILLSGTLFQNSFDEYFNTLSLARPRFISEVLRELDPLYGVKNRKGYRRKDTKRCKEILARKFFVDKIGRRIHSKYDEDRKKGLNKLKQLTTGFVDVYEGDGSDCLPGLQAYALLLKPTPAQDKAMLKLLEYDCGTRYSLEYELTITLVSIHPWLLTSLECLDKFFNDDERKELAGQRHDITRGSKVRFVVNLVQKCVHKREKVLIFCRNIAPMRYLMEIFKNMFNWAEGEEMLILHGDQLVFQRTRMIDKFEDPGGNAQVLLASIGCCGEGISLTAASRVVLLDSEWNPSKIKQAVGRAFRQGQEKIVYVYQLLTSGTVEEKKHSKTAWKDWVSRMIFVGNNAKNSSHAKAENIDDEVLREIVEEDESDLFHLIMKDEKLMDRKKNETTAVFHMKGTF